MEQEIDLRFLRGDLASRRRPGAHGRLTENGRQGDERTTDEQREHGHERRQSGQGGAQTQGSFRFSSPLPGHREGVRLPAQTAAANAGSADGFRKARELSLDPVLRARSAQDDTRPACGPNPRPRRSRRDRGRRLAHAPRTGFALGQQLEGTAVAVGSGAAAGAFCGRWRDGCCLGRGRRRRPDVHSPAAGGRCAGGGGGSTRSSGGEKPRRGDAAAARAELKGSPRSRGCWRKSEPARFAESSPPPPVALVAAFTSACAVRCRAERTSRRAPVDRPLPAHQQDEQDVEQRGPEQPDRRRPAPGRENP